jgi:Uma2 family endonuclease
MATAVTETPVQAVVQGPARKRWTRSECAVIEDAGLFDQERVELIDGELISKLGKKRPHVDTGTRLFAWLLRVFGDDNVNSEAPINVAAEDNPTNEPVPDLIVLKPSYSGLSAPPQPNDLHLVVEVADSSLTFDLTVKAALYARAGIVEYWVLDVSDSATRMDGWLENGFGQ